MSQLTYRGQTYGCRPGETVLEASLRHGLPLPFSCRNGICHACLQRAVRGTLPEKSQAGLRDSLKEKNYFLPCVCRPEHDLEFAPPQDEDLYFKAVVTHKEPLAKEIFRIRLEPYLEVRYHAGQFIRLRRPDGLVRSYSLAGVPGEDTGLELHVRRWPQGNMSQWLANELQVNDEIDIQGPNGHCLYLPQNLTQNLLLIGTGTGLAPLLSIVRTALSAGHSGQLYLYHGSSSVEGLYWIGELRQLARNAPNFHYIPCVSRGQAPSGFESGRAHTLAFSRHPDLSGWRVHLAGHPDMVSSAALLAQQAGASPQDILADPFTGQNQTTPLSVFDTDRLEFPPDPEMWAALEEGRLMREILTDFYTRVYRDPVLSPYFRGITQERVTEKVYSFMRQIFTGEKGYFGDRPRNAHHWMVISDDIFDYRENLMATCLREHGLAEHLIARWQAIEHSFRKDIVKSQPWPRVVAGVEQPVEGFGHTVLEVGSLCDGCGRQVEPGEEVSYHLRLGQIYCATCRKLEERPL